MDGEDRAIDNVFTGNLSRSIKFEKVYINAKKAWSRLRKVLLYISGFIIKRRFIMRTLLLASRR